VVENTRRSASFSSRAELLKADAWLQKLNAILRSPESQQYSRKHGLFTNLRSGMANRSQRVSALVAIKLLHTAVWVVLAVCIVALPITALLHHFDWAIILTVIIVAECSVLALNNGQCPLTNVAARFTDQRTDNFDIYLPNWAARHNKAIFGTLFVINELFVMWRWLK
jgi:hypothetical protein